MSTLYNLEPQPTAKVLLKTTTGDIVLEIWAKQTPLTSRNFLQHCINGYYDNTIFHRLVPGFIIQGGDPTGLGTGGDSALDNGAPFADEPHTRLRFNRRGLLGMANSGEPNDNTSQFFLTLDKTPELQGKNTMFGRVEGDTIYNLMRMGEAELAEEGGDRPLYPTKVIGTEILLNPFEDMVKRVLIAERTKDDKSASTGKKKRKAGKTLLSFGGDEGETEAPKVKKAKVNPNFTQAGIETGEDLNNTPMAAAPEKAKAKPSKAPRRRSPSRSASPPPAMGAEKQTSGPTAQEASRVDKSPSPESPQIASTMSALDRTNAQIAALKESMKRNVSTAKEAPEKKKSALEEMIPSTSTKGRKRGKGADEAGALDIFNAFKKRIGEAPRAANTSKDQTPFTNGTHDASETQPASTEAEDKLCDLHFIANCQSCTAWDDDGGPTDKPEEDDSDWINHSLSFAKDVLGKDLAWKKKMEEYEVIDPREKAQDIAAERKKDRHKSGKITGKEWDQRRDRGGQRQKA